MASFGGISLPFNLGHIMWFCRGHGADPIEQGECPACKGETSVVLEGVHYRCPHPRCKEGTLVYYEYTLLPDVGKVHSIKIQYDLVEPDAGPEQQSTCEISVRTDDGDLFVLRPKDIFFCEEDAQEACVQKMDAALEEQKQRKVH